MLFRKNRPFRMECRVRLASTIKLIQEALASQVIVVDRLAIDCHALRQDALLSSRLSLGDGKVFDMALLADRQENLRQYRQLREEVDVYSRELVDILDTAMRMLVMLRQEDTLAKSVQEERIPSSPAQQLMTGIDNLMAKLVSDKQQIEIMQRKLAGEILRTKQIEEIRSMLS